MGNYILSTEAFKSECVCGYISVVPSRGSVWRYSSIISKLEKWKSEGLHIEASICVAQTSDLRLYLTPHLSHASTWSVTITRNNFPFKILTRLKMDLRKCKTLVVKASKNCHALS